MLKARDTLRSKYLGAIMGAAVGDALAFPLRNYSRNFLASVAQPLTEELQTCPDGFTPLGQTTGDTQCCNAVITSILERGDLKADAESAKLLVEHLIPLWRDMSIVDPASDNSSAMSLIVKGITEWDNAALPFGNAGSGCLTRAIPIGLWNARDPEKIPDQVKTLVTITHQDDRTLAATSAMAAFIAYNVSHDELILGDILDNISSTAGEFDEGVAQAILDLPKILSQTDHRALEMILAISPDEEYPPSRDELTDYVVPVLFLALRQFLNKPQSFEDALNRILRLGGNMSTIASITGALCGSYLGLENIPGNLVDNLLEKEEIQRNAEMLFELRRNLKRIEAATEQTDPVGKTDEPGVDAEDPEDLNEDLESPSE